MGGGFVLCLFSISSDLVFLFRPPLLLVGPFTFVCMVSISRHLDVCKHTCQRPSDLTSDLGVGALCFGLSTLLCLVSLVSLRSLAWSRWFRRLRSQAHPVSLRSPGLAGVVICSTKTEWKK